MGHLVAVLLLVSAEHFVDSQEMMNEVFRLSRTTAEIHRCRASQQEARARIDRGRDH
jgi:hypothetical protein